MKESKFKVGDSVVCVDSSHGCRPILDKMCIITKVRESLFTAHEYGYEVMCNNADCESDKETTYWVVDENQLEPYIIQPTVQDCLTDPDIDYEKITENPIYFEFVDIGKALNKLKEYEHSLMEQINRNVLEQEEKYALRYIVGYIDGVLRIGVGCIVGTSKDKIEIKFENGAIVPYPRDRVYTTYTEALERFKERTK